MKSLLFVYFLLMSWQTFAVASSTQSDPEEEQSEVILTESKAVIEKNTDKSTPAKIETPPQPEVKVQQLKPVQDVTKVIGSEAPKVAEQPKTQQEKAVAVSEAEKAVAQAKEALTKKQQAKAKQSREALGVVEQLIAAYNAKNIEAFISLYDENVEFYAFPNELMFKGKEKLIARYGIMFKKLKCIQSSPIKRIVHGNIVIDHELSETCSKDAKVVDKRAEFVTSYQVDNGKITKVLFFR